MKLRQVMLFAKDIDKMTAFYRDGLGLTVTNQFAGWAELAAGDCSSALHAIPKHIADRIEITTPPRRRSETPYKVTFLVDDLEEARERLNACGGFMNEITRADHGAFCDGLDPEGNLFVIMEGA
jgi:catechol 2,3-dioxygenase-like lactoylglutathione lyase family enzyme